MKTYQLLGVVYLLIWTMPKSHLAIVPSQACQPNDADENNIRLPGWLFKLNIKLKRIAKN